MRYTYNSTPSILTLVASGSITGDTTAFEQKLEANSKRKQSKKHRDGRTTRFLSPKEIREHTKAFHHETSLRSKETVSAETLFPGK